MTAASSRPAAAETPDWADKAASKVLRDFHHSPYIIEYHIAAALRAAEERGAAEMRAEAVSVAAELWRVLYRSQVNEEWVAGLVHRLGYDPYATPPAQDGGSETLTKE